MMTIVEKGKGLVGKKRLGGWVLGVGCWVLGVGYRVLGIGC
jgi:hypothetical protein